MPIITISRGSYSKGKSVAEKIAKKLNYECVSRDIILSASKEFNIPEIKLVRALHDAPSVLDRFTNGKERYVCHLRKSLLEYALRGNLVYHGLAGHYFLSGLDNVFKLRITSDMNDRIREEMRRENMSESEARHLLMKDDDERRKWGMQLYGIDTWDSRSYDMVLHIGNLTEDDATDIICNAVQKKAFQETSLSQKQLANMYLSVKIQSAIIDIQPTAIVKSNDGVVNIVIPDAQSSLTDKATRKILAKVENIDGVKNVQILLPEAVKGMINPFHNIK
ncbi:AAA family ATPase [Pseudodesulfovibrio sp.]|uniref:cytidylate kinase-like family protein n=1 Tax=unclassified Pseudodesulfovibrio TaxID=2661612 RepID=UPI003B003B36